MKENTKQGVVKRKSVVSKSLLTTSLISIGLGERDPMTMILMELRITLNYKGMMDSRI